MSSPSVYFRRWLVATLRVAVIVAAGFSSAHSARAEGKSIFNGVDLTGWMQVGSNWSVKDGAISCNPTDDGSFLVWQGGMVSDFELTCKFRFIDGFDKKWWVGGIRFRNRITNPDHLYMDGSHADMNLGFNNTGCLFEAGPRGMLAWRGERQFIVNSGDILHPTAFYVPNGLKDVEKVGPAFKRFDWNEYKVVAVGRHILLFLNGVQTVDSVDATSVPMLSGVLGLVKGPVEFKDLVLRDLSSYAVAPPVCPLPVDARPKATGVTCSYVKDGSAGTKPIGTVRWNNVRMETDDPNAVTDAKPVYFDIKSGTEIRYDVQSPTPLTELSFTGVAFNNFRIQILDPKGQMLTSSGPYYGGNNLRVLRMPLPSVSSFRVVFKTDSLDWLLFKDLHFGSGAAPAMTLAANRPVVVAAPATPVPIPRATPYAAPIVVAATPVPTPFPKIPEKKPSDPIVGRWKQGRNVVVLNDNGSASQSAPNFHENGQWRKTGTRYEINWGEGRIIVQELTLHDGNQEIMIFNREHRAVHWAGRAQQWDQ